MCVLQCGRSVNVLTEGTTILPCGNSRAWILGFQGADELEALQIMGELHPHLSSLLSLPIPSVRDHPIRPAPERPDAVMGGGEGRARVAGHEGSLVGDGGGGIVPAGMTGLVGKGLICAIGGSDGLRDLALVETLRVGPTLSAVADGMSAEEDVCEGGGGGVARRWGAAVGLPVRLRAAACALAGGALYVVGGWDGREACQNAYVYRQCTGGSGGDWAWQAIAPLQRRRQALACAVVHDKVYAIGGFDGTSNLRSVERYDAGADAWRGVADMLQCRRGCAAAAINGQLIVVGGSDATAVHSSVESYNMYSNVWTSLASMSTPRRLASAAVACGKLVVVGGWDGVRALSSCEAYVPETGAWESVAPMAQVRHGAAAVTAASKMYVLGGWDGVSSHRLSSVEVLSADLSAWTAAPSLDCARFGLCAAFLPLD